MKSFHQFINEGRYPGWIKVVVGGIVVKLHNIGSQLKNETDQHKRDVLLGQQNKLLGIISGLGIGVEYI